MSAFVSISTWLDCTKCATSWFIHRDQTATTTPYARQTTSIRVEHCAQHAEKEYAK